MEAEFYSRLRDAMECPKCAESFARWIVLGEGSDIENLRGEEVVELKGDFFHAENIYYSSEGSWSDFSSDLKAELTDRLPVTKEPSQ